MQEDHHETTTTTRPASVPLLPTSTTARVEAMRATSASPPSGSTSPSSMAPPAFVALSPRRRAESANGGARGGRKGGPLARLASQKAVKSNSTSSLFIKDTLGSPDTKDLIGCVASAVQVHIRAGKECGYEPKDDPFDERLYFHGQLPASEKRVPSVNAVSYFLERIYRRGRLANETLVMMLVYIERLMSHSPIKVHPINWKLMCLSALILSSKVWEDLAVWNRDFAKLFKEIGITELNNLERHFLKTLKYDVCVKASTYAQYYFELRSLAEDDLEHFDLQPLTQEQAEALESRSLGHVTKVKRASQRSASTNNLRDNDDDVHKGPRLILS